MAKLIDWYRDQVKDEFSFLSMMLEMWKSGFCCLMIVGGVVVIGLILVLGLILSSAFPCDKGPLGHCCDTAHPCQQSH